MRSRIDAIHKENWFRLCRYARVIGLAHDEIGYVLPKSQWDAEPPFTYDYQDASYGEIMSLGPNTAPQLSQAVYKVLRELPK